ARERRESHSGPATGGSYHLFAPISPCYAFLHNLTCIRAWRGGFCMPAAIRVTPWPDPVLDVIGHDPRSWYAEPFWLPTLGPTALLLLRHLADRFQPDPSGIALPVADTAVALGLGPREGQHSPLMRSLNRLQQFELACPEHEASIAVRRALPPVHRRHV